MPKYFEDKIMIMIVSKSNCKYASMLPSDNYWAAGCCALEYEKVTWDERLIKAKQV